MKVYSHISCLSLAALMMGLSACGSKGNEPDPSRPSDRPANLVFEDEFEKFDTKYWTKEAHAPGWVNGELQTYSPTKVTVGRDGNRSVLIITAERNAGHIYSGRVNSKGKVNFRYGKVEASIRLPKTARGLWPAFWMMGDNDANWPACGEIDIMEMGAQGGYADNTESRFVNSAIHFGASLADHTQLNYAANFDADLQDDQYHKYTLQWTPETLTVSIDDRKFTTFDIAGKPEFQDKYYLLFNMACGGAFTGIDNIDGITALPEGGKAQMMIDWVRIYSE